MARHATHNAQQTIYLLYFGAFGTQCKETTIWFWEGGGCQILFGQMIYFRRGLGREIYYHVAWARENLFSCKHGITTASLQHWGNY